ncbi:MAG: acyltransferase [Planctomycetota bacterium]
MNHLASTEQQLTDLALPRRHEIDALRSIALVLLIVYHVFVAFQPFASWIMFIGSSESLQSAWFLGELFNSWRIPVLFLMSGITAGYLVQNRPVGTLVSGRLVRLVPPLLVTCVLIAPVTPALFQVFDGEPVRYMPNPGHLWFVWNLVVYMVFAAPVFLYLRYRPGNLVMRWFSRLSPYTWVVVLPVVLMIVTTLLEPHISVDNFSVHFLRFWNGFACFVAGAVLVSLGDRFWWGIRRVCHVSLPVALALYLMRMAEVGLGSEFAELAARTAESTSGMLAFLGYGSLAFARPSRVFGVLNRAVFAVYIVHMPVQQAVSLALVPAEMNAWVDFGVRVVLTIALSALIYAVVLRPVRWVHPFFGIAPLRSAPPATGRAPGAARLKRPWPVRIGRVAALYLVTPVLALGAVAIHVWPGIPGSRDTDDSMHPEALDPEDGGRDP